MVKRMAKDLGDEGSADRPRRSSRRIASVSKANDIEEEVIQEVRAIHVWDTDSILSTSIIQKYLVLRLLYSSRAPTSQHWMAWELSLGSSIHSNNSLTLDNTGGT